MTERTSEEQSSADAQEWQALAELWRGEAPAPEVRPRLAARLGRDRRRTGWVTASEILLIAAFAYGAVRYWATHRGWHLPRTR